MKIVRRITLLIAALGSAGLAALVFVNVMDYRQRAKSEFRPVGDRAHNKRARPTRPGRARPPAIARVAWTGGRRPPDGARNAWGHAVPTAFAPGR
jgi:hypothetical protein